MTVAVIGDIIVDHFYEGESNRLSPENQAPVFNPTGVKSYLGGAGNVWNNLISLQLRDAHLLGVANKKLEDFGFFKANSNVFLIKEETRKLTEKHRFGKYLRVDIEDTFEITEAQEDLFINYLKGLSGLTHIVVSDYNKGMVTRSLMQKLYDSFINTYIFVDPKGEDYNKYLGATMIKPNKNETGTGLSNFPKVLVTGGGSGMTYWTNYLTISYHHPSLARKVVEVAGAGDTVMAALVIADRILPWNTPIKEMLHFVSAVAAVVVEKPGIATATWEEINEMKKRI